MSRIGFILLVAALAGPVADAFALPRYAARYEQNCNLCHFNPSGGGQRDVYASQYLVPTEMVLQSYDYDELGRIDPTLGDNVIIGADLRTIARYSDDDEARSQNNFFHMQSDIYVTLQVDERFAAYFDRGGSDTYEAFALARLLPFNGYLKTGRFTPAYGWKWADHNAFVREKLGFMPPAHTDVGVEAGIFPGSGAVQLAVLNGSPGSRQDFNDEPSVVIRGEYRRHVRGVGVAVGGSYQRNDDRPGADFPAEPRYHGGPFGYLAWKRLTWLGEVDWVRVSPPGGAPDTTGLVASHEIACQVTPGLDLVAAYSFHDPDVDLETGIEERWSGGFELFYNPFAKLSVLVQSYRSEPGGEIEGREYTQLVAQVHFLY